MKDLLEYLVKNLVSKPDNVKIEEETVDNIQNFKLSVDPADMGMIIGKLGQTIKAIRRLLITKAFVENPNLRINVDLQEVQ